MHDQTKLAEKEKQAFQEVVMVCDGFLVGAANGRMVGWLRAVGSPGGGLNAKGELGCLLLARPGTSTLALCAGCLQGAGRRSSILTGRKRDKNLPSWPLIRRIDRRRT